MKPDKTQENWRKIHKKDTNLYQWLDAGRIMIPIICVLLLIGLVIFAVFGSITILANVIDVIRGAFSPHSTQLRLGGLAMFWIVTVFASVAIVFMVIAKVARWLKLPISIPPDMDSLYYDVRETAYKAVDENVCDKMQIYTPKTPSELKGVSAGIDEKDGVSLFKVEFEKVTTDKADLNRFRHLLDRGIVRLRKRRELPTSLSQDFLYRGVTYPPLLIMRLYQDSETITVVFAFTDERSCELYINSRGEKTNVGQLYDDEL